MVGTPFAAFVFTATSSYMAFMFTGGIFVAICVVLVVLATRIRVTAVQQSENQPDSNE
jgi:hypothetical protein